jgi:hypothetical protein
MRAKYLLCVAITLCLFTAIPVSADTVLYTNGAINGTLAGYSFSSISGWEVTNSFTISQPSIVNRASFGAWLLGGDTLTSVDWLITSDAFAGTTYGSGTVNPTDAYQSSFYGYDIYSESFSTGNVALAAGTYWFELLNGITQNTNNVYWDENDGASIAYQYASGEIRSESFTLYQSIDSPAVPEPTALLLLGTGIVGIGLSVLRRRK